MLVMDSGLVGLSVVRALRAATPGLPLLYLADTAGFPYGGKSPEVIANRTSQLIQMLQNQTPFKTAVLACNTLSTLCLASLRAQFPYAFVGTVPAVKVAAAESKSKRFALLATPNTAHSRYTDQLIAEFAQGCTVDAVPAPNLASYAEKILLGESVAHAALCEELAPAFANDAKGKTDAVVLGCTHYPLILDQLKAAAPWSVQWIDSGAAIARRAHTLMDTPPAHSIAYVTAEADIARYQTLFKREGFADVRALTLS